MCETSSRGEAAPPSESVAQKGGRGFYPIRLTGLQRHNSFAADPLVLVGRDAIGIGTDELELDCRRANVQDEDVHRLNNTTAGPQCRR